MSSFISNCPLKNASLSGKLSHNGPFEQQKPYVDARSETLTTPEATIEIGQSCPATAPSGSNPDSPSWMLALAAEVTNKQIHERNSNYQHVLLKLSSDLEHKLLSPLSPPPHNFPQSSSCNRYSAPLITLFYSETRTVKNSHQINNVKLIPAQSN